MKNKLILLSLLILVIPFIYAYECPKDSPITKIPCEVVSPNDIYVSPNCTAGNYNYSIENLNTSTEVLFDAMSLKAGTTYNFSFNQTGYDVTYRVYLCDGSTQDFNVVINDDSRWLYVIIFLVIIVLYLIGRKMEDNWFIIGAGLITLSFSVYMFIQGLFDFNNEILNWAIFLILFGIGAHFTVSYGIEELKK